MSEPKRQKRITNNKDEGKFSPDEAEEVVGSIEEEGNESPEPEGEDLDQNIEK